MSKFICPQCGGEISAESGAAFSDCVNCGKAAQTAPIKAETEASKNAGEKFKKRFFYAACVFALMSLPLLYFGGFYWLLNRQPEGTTWFPIQPHETSRPKPTRRPKNPNSISPSEIVRIEYTDSINRTQYVTQYFSNYPIKNYLFRESKVTFLNNGQAKKTFVQRETVNFDRTPERSEKYAGAFPPEKFAELARIFVENDFTGEEYASISSGSSVNQMLTVVYLSSHRVRMFHAGDTGSDTPEAEAMLKAFKELENKIDWQKQE